MANSMPRVSNWTDQYKVNQNYPYTTGTPGYAGRVSGQNSTGQGGGDSGAVWTTPGQTASTTGAAWAASQAKNNPVASSPADALLAEYKRASAAANAANEARYQEIKADYDKRYAETMGWIEGTGTARRTEIGRSYTGLGSKAQQALTDRGLANSSIVATTAAGTERQKQSSLTELEDALLREKATLGAQLSGDKLQFMENRTDQAPDFNQLIELYRLYGQNTQQQQPVGSYYGMTVPAAMSIPQYNMPYYYYSGNYGNSGNVGNQAYNWMDRGPLKASNPWG